jgi:hypothetical protein
VKYGGPIRLLGSVISTQYQMASTIAVSLYLISLIVGTPDIVPPETIIYDRDDNRSHRDRLDS